jgi:hypothetical protein
MKIALCILLTMGGVMGMNLRFLEISRNHGTVLCNIALGKIPRKMKTVEVSRRGRRFFKN